MANADMHALGDSEATDALDRSTGNAIAMLALSTPLNIDPVALARRYGERWGGPAPQVLSATDGTFTFLLEGALGFVAAMPAPIPNNDLDSAVRSAWWWRDAGPTLAGHRAHAIVGITGHAGGPVATRVALTRLMACVVELSDSLGVYWGDAGLVQSAGTLLALADRLGDGILPVMLWVNIQIGPDLAAEEEGRPGRFAAYTVGMHALGHLDIQARDAAVDGRWLFETIHDLAGYMLTAGAVIADGDTIGAHDGDRVLVRHQPSFVRDGAIVIELMPQARA